MQRQIVIASLSLVTASIVAAIVAARVKIIQKGSDEQQKRPQPERQRLPPHVQQSGLQIPHSPPPGLPNRSHVACFLNATIQSLASSSHFLHYLSQFRSAAPPPLSLAKLLLNMSEILVTPNAKVPHHRLNAVSRHLCSKFPSLFGKREQQDAMEFLVLLMAEMDVEEKLLDENARGFIDAITGGKKPRQRSNPFRGYSSSSLNCEHCSTPSTLQISPFHLITACSGSDATCALTEMFKSDGEVVSGVECSNCAIKHSLDDINSETITLEELLLDNDHSEDNIYDRKIRRQIANNLFLKSALELIPADFINPKHITAKSPRRNKIRRELLIRVGDVLVIHINRTQMQGKKDNGRFGIDDVLDVGKILQNAAYDKLEFRLFAVVEHLGNNSNFGHYVSYVRRQTNWYKCDDERVTSIDKTKVLSSVQAYLLFYEKKI